MESQNEADYFSQPGPMPENNTESNEIEVERNIMDAVRKPNNTDSWEERFAPKLIINSEINAPLKEAIKSWLSVYYDKLKPLISQELEKAHGQGLMDGGKFMNDRIKEAHDSGYQKGKNETQHANIREALGEGAVEVAIKHAYQKGRESSVPLKLLIAEDAIRQEERQRIIQVIEELATRLITCHEDRTDSYDDAAQYGHEKALEELLEELKEKI